jgi:hypothetical protein
MLICKLRKKQLKQYTVLTVFKIIPSPHVPINLLKGNETNEKTTKITVSFHSNYLPTKGPLTDI